MSSQPAICENRRPFDRDIHGMVYVNRIRAVTAENGFRFLSVTIAALRGLADNVQPTYVECVVVSE